MPVNLTVTFAPEIDRRALDPLAITDERKKFIAYMCCEHAHLKMDGADIVTCCHAGHPSFMIRDGKVVGTSA